MLKDKIKVQPPQNNILKNNEKGKTKEESDPPGSCL